MDVLPTIRFPTLVRGGNDFYNYLCLEIPSRKAVNMPPAENRNSFSSSIISELFFNQSLKLLLVSQGQQGTERQGWNVACGVLTETYPQAAPGTDQGPGAGKGTGTDTVHLRVHWLYHSWSPLSPRSAGSSRLQGCHLGPVCSGFPLPTASLCLLQPPASGPFLMSRATLGTSNRPRL